MPETNEIRIFYHISAKDNWKQVVHEQLLSICDSQLIYPITSAVTGSDEDISWISRKAAQLGLNLELSYSAQILDHKEHPTLQLIEEWAKKQEEGACLYLNTDNTEPSYSRRQLWQAYATKHLIENWRQCVQLLRRFDTVGLSWMGNYYSGDTWWATTKHLRNLPSICEYEKRVFDEDSVMKNRRSYPSWIGSSKHRQYSLRPVNDNNSENALSQHLTYSRYKRSKVVSTTFYTPVKGRLDYLKQVYLENLKAAEGLTGIDFVLVNMNSPDGMDAWVKSCLEEYLESGVLKYYQLVGAYPHYSISHADNCAALLSSGEIVSNFMADNIGTSDYYDHVSRLPEGHFAYFGKNARDATGRISFWKKDFIRLRGYDEKMFGHGFQDNDIIRRAKAAQLLTWPLRGCWAQFLSHSNDLRHLYTVKPTATFMDSREENKMIMNGDRNFINQKGFGRGRFIKYGTDEIVEVGEK